MQQLEGRAERGALEQIDIQIRPVRKTETCNVWQQYKPCVCQKLTCSFPHLGQHKSTNLTRGVALAASLNPCITIGVLDDLVGNHLQN